MKTIQRSISFIRGLLQEELDIVGASASSETCFDPCFCTFSTPNGIVTVIDDMSAHPVPD
jgi:hypothetical protein